MKSEYEALKSLPHTDKIIHIWDHILPPSYQKLGEMLGFEVKGQNIVKLADPTPPFRDAARHYAARIEDFIRAYGVPKVIVASDLHIPERSSRKLMGIIFSLEKVATKYHTKVVFISSKELIPPDPLNR